MMGKATIHALCLSHMLSVYSPNASMEANHRVASHIAYTLADYVHSCRTKYTCKNVLLSPQHDHIWSLYSICVYRNIQFDVLACHPPKQAERANQVRGLLSSIKPR